MMNANRILNYITAEPFRPFRLNMVSGKPNVVRHPEMLAVGRTTVHVYSSMSIDQEEAEERDQELSIILIESIEPLDTTVQQD